MQYYFDESGNWSGGERHILVLGGLMVGSDIDVNKMQTEFKMLKSEHGLSYLHGQEMTKPALEDCYAIINSLLTKDANALLKVFSPRVVHSRSKISADEVYIALASDLVATLIFSDNNPEINYDMKFYYAYPENVIQETRKSKELYFVRMMKSFELLEQRVVKEQERIMKKLSDKKIVDKPWAEKYISYINDDPKQAVSDYLWSELIMQIQGNENAKESFRSNILSNLRKINEFTGSSRQIPNLIMRFLPKEKENAGVEAIDILCNLVYKNGILPHQNASSTVKAIYSKIVIEGE